MPPPIEPTIPDTWRDLEIQCGGILQECGYEVRLQESPENVRGHVAADIWARDTALPATVVLVECKKWKDAVPQTIVHAFRTVMVDTGANLGFIVSTSGFQSGAFEAASLTNIRLLNWSEFQDVFVERWYSQFMVPRLRAAADPLFEYTEAINERVFRSADALPEADRERFIELRKKHFSLGMGLIPLWWPVLDPEGAVSTPALPLAPRLKGVIDDLPPEVTEATSLRNLLTALVEAYGTATAEFDALFGGRI